MGLLDRLIKRAVRTGINTATDTIIDNTVKPKVEGTIKDSLGIKDIKYSIPSEYNDFPTYPSNMINKPYEKETNNYKRITLNYSENKTNEYKEILLSNNYTKASNIRYTKDNKSIIIEENANNVKIVYQINK